MCARTQTKNKENGLKIWRVFPPGRPPSLQDSFWLAAIWSTSPGALERSQLQLQRATLGSPVAFLVWPESSPEECEKTAPTPQLPGAITLPSKLRFTRTLCLWNELSDDMLHDPFWEPEDLQKLPRKSSQKMVRVRKSRRIQWRGCVADKIATWRAVRLPRPHHVPRGTGTHEACHSAYKRNPPPPHFQVHLARAPRLFECSLGRK